MPATMPDPEITPHLTAAQGFARLMLHRAQDLDAGLGDLGGPDPITGLHKARVALRRLTTCLDLFAPLLRDHAREVLRARAKACFRLMGRQRDADVYLTRWAKDDERARLTRKGAELRAATRRRLGQAGAPGLAAEIRKDLAKGRLLGRRKSRVARQKLPLAGFAARALTPVWAACIGHGSSLVPLTPKARHGLRKDLKSLRYALEFFAPVLRGERVEPLLADLRHLQDLLGELNDLDQAQKRRSDLLAKDQGLAAQAGMVLAQAEALWQAVGVAGPAWGS